MLNPPVILGISTVSRVWRLVQRTRHVAVLAMLCDRWSSWSYTPDALLSRLNIGIFCGKRRAHRVPKDEIDQGRITQLGV